MGLLTDLLTLAFDGLGEDVADTGRVLAKDVRVDAQSHRGVGVAEPGGDYVDRDACEKTWSHADGAGRVAGGGAVVWPGE